MNTVLQGVMTTTEAEDIVAIHDVTNTVEELQGVTILSMVAIAVVVIHAAENIVAAMTIVAMQDVTITAAMALKVAVAKSVVNTSTTMALADMTITAVMIVIVGHAAKVTNIRVNIVVTIVVDMVIAMLVVGVMSTVIAVDTNVEMIAMASMVPRVLSALTSHAVTPMVRFLSLHKTLIPTVDRTSQKCLKAWSGRCFPRMRRSVCVA
jgi:hypothetical protein